MYALRAPRWNPCTQPLSTRGQGASPPRQSESMPSPDDLAAPAGCRDRDPQPPAAPARPFVLDVDHQLAADRRPLAAVEDVERSGRRERIGSPLERVGDRAPTGRRGRDCSRNVTRSTRSVTCAVTHSSRTPPEAPDRLAPQRFTRCDRWPLRRRQGIAVLYRAVCLKSTCLVIRPAIGRGGHRGRHPQTRLRDRPQANTLPAPARSGGAKPEEPRGAVPSRQTKGRRCIHVPSQCCRR